jgi:DNA/RNA-binding domain of Phe-tRNA-synthetase-like protein
MKMLLLNELTDQYGDVSLGMLVMRHAGAALDAGLAPARRALEASLREKYASVPRADLKALHPMDAFVGYYKKFGYTYHVLPQLESVIKGRDFPAVLPLVSAMFMAELKNMLLTAGHDLDKIVLPMRLRASTGQETLVSLGGKEAMTVSGDLMITDGAGVLSAVLRGADARTAITGETQNVVYTAYAPAGIEPMLVLEHLSDIEAYVRLAAPDAVTEVKELYQE